MLLLWFLCLLPGPGSYSQCVLGVSWIAYILLCSLLCTSSYAALHYVISKEQNPSSTHIAKASEIQLLLLSWLCLVLLDLAILGTA